MGFNATNVLNACVLLFLKSMHALSVDNSREYLTFNIEYPKKLFNMPLRMDRQTYELKFNSAVYGINMAHNTHEYSQSNCCWRVCVQKSECIDTCSESETEANVTMTGFKLNITSQLNKELHGVTCRGSVRIEVLSYYCDIRTVQTDRTNSRLYTPGDVTYVKCDHSNDGKGCQQVICQSTGSWSLQNGCHLHHDDSGKCSFDTDKDDFSRLSQPSEVFMLSTSVGMFAATIPSSMPGLSSLSSSSLSSSPSSHLVQTITGTFPLSSPFSSFSVVSEKSSIIDGSNMSNVWQTFPSSILHSSRHFSSLIEISVFSKWLPNSSHPLESKLTLNGEQTTAILSNEIQIKNIRPTRSSFYQSQSVSHSSRHFSSLTEISVFSKWLPNSNHPLESKLTLNGEQTTAILSNEIQIKNIRPTRSSFYQSQSVSHPTNESALTSLSVVTSPVEWFGSAYITKAPVLNTDGSVNTVDAKDKPDSTVALGIVIGVFVIIVAVLLAMILRVVYRSAMETKDEDMPRATIPAVNQGESQGVQIEAVQVTNRLFLNISGDFSESNTDDDVSNKSDVSLQSNSDTSNTQNQSSTNGRSRHHTSRKTSTHQTTFSNDTGCFKVSRLSNRTREKKCDSVTAHDLDSDIYAVSYKQKKTSRR